VQISEAGFKKGRYHLWALLSSWVSGLGRIEANSLGVPVGFIQTEPLLCMSKRDSDSTFWIRGVHIRAFISGKTFTQTEPNFSCLSLFFSLLVIGNKASCTKEMKKKGLKINV